MRLKHPHQRLYCPDHTVVPDMGAEAMENWGLVTYEPSALLIGQQVSSNDDKYYVGQVVSHEIAHTVSTCMPY